MSKYRGRRRLRAACGAALVLGAVLPASAAATPSGFVACRGTLAKATATVDDANLLNYSFGCDGDIQSYTIVANRQLNDFSTLDDFSTSVAVLSSPGRVPSTTQSASCQAALPGNGINCFAASSAKLPVVTAHQYIEGSFDTTDPYCGVPAQTVTVKGKKGKTTTKTTPAEQRAVVQLVVTDSTGAQFGPFSLALNPSCPTVHKTKAKAKARTKTKTKKVAKAKSA